MQKKLQDLLKMAEVSGSSDLNSIANQVQRLSRIASAQKNANLSVIQQFIPKIIYNLVNNIEEALPQTQQLSKVQLYAKVLRQLQQFAPPGSIDATYVNSLDQARKDLQSRARQITMDKVTQIKQNQLVNSLITQQLNNSPQISPPTLGLRLPTDTSYKGIQRQVEGILDIVDNPPMTGILDIQSLPSTMKLLARYAEQIGYKATGQLTGKRSRAYVGINSVMQDDVQINKPFPFQQRMMSTGQNASIKQSYRYFAGQTITAWNEYVSTEEKFVEFANKVSTKQKRQQYVTQQIKGMNKATFCAQVMATVMHYYVVLPLRWMIRKSRRDLQGLSDGDKDLMFTKSWFQTNFQMPPGSNSNPLTLSYQVIKQMFPILIPDTSTKCIDLYQKLITVIETNALLSIGKTNMKKLTGYASQRTFQSSVYLKSLGIPAKTIKTIQERQNVQNLIFSKVVFPTVYANNEVLALISKAIQQQVLSDPLQDSAMWGVKWQDQKLPAHDYIWGGK